MAIAPRPRRSAHFSFAALLLIALSCSFGVIGGMGAAAPAAAPANPLPQASNPCNFALLGQEIQRNPQDVNARVTRAACIMNSTPSNTTKPPLQSLEVAMNDLEAALKLQPNNWVAVHNYAQVAYLFGYDDFAVQQYTKAISLNPKDARGYLGRGWSYYNECHVSDAAKDFAQAARMDGSLAREGPSQPAVLQQQRQCARPPAPAQTARNCPPKNIVAFSLTARIVLENEWRRQHPGCP